MKNWIESKGSPFVIMDKKFAKKWSGLDGKEYEIICTVTNYAEPVCINGHNVLVLGDEAMPIKVICNDNEIIILRWIYAANDSIVDEILNKTNFMTLPVIENFDIVWDSLELILFDSVDTFDKATNIIHLKIKNKHCMISTRHYEDNLISLIIHHIVCSI